jgi:PAS domain S-box-containing protein
MFRLDARADMLLAAEKRTLEMIANGASLPDVLDDLCRTVDAYSPPAISTVLLTDPDGTRLRPGAGPHFPAALRNVVNPWPIGPGAGSCGTAAYLKERVIIADVTTDPRFPDEYRELAIKNGLRASWSEPLISTDGAVLGTFALYYDEPRTPRARDIELIKTASHIALIAIQMERSQKALRDRQESFGVVANNAPVMIWLSGVDKVRTYFNRPWFEFTGRTPESELGNNWTKGIHPDDSVRAARRFTEAFDRREPYHMEYRLKRHDGEYRWIHCSGIPRFDADGSFAGYVGSAIDVSERKLAEENFSNMNQRLIEAQEDERARIARELHDNINQRLILLSLTLDRLQHNLPDSVNEVGRKIGDVRKQLADVVQDAYDLSRGLHPARLEYLGLPKAAASFCKELAGQHDVKIGLKADGVYRNLSKDVSLCLYRVLQEALHNAIKFSGSRQFEVRLASDPHEIHLRIRDHGIGFDPDSVKGNGLGLTSMKERLRSVGGELSIESLPRLGTTIHARVPQRDESS